MHYTEFSTKIKTKYPEYKDIDDRELAEKIIAKYPEYSDVTFDDNTPTKTSFKDVVNDLPAVQIGKGLVKGFSSLGTGLGKQFVNPIREKLGKAPLTDTELDNAYGFLDDKPTGAIEKTAKFIGETVPYMVLPEAKAFQGAGLASRVGNVGLTGAYQGGAIGGLESLKNQGDLSGVGAGAGIGSLMGGFPLVGSAYNKLKGVSTPILSKITGLKPETLQRAVQPDSVALDLTSDQAENLLMNTTERVRDNYNQLLKNRGNKVGEAIKNLDNNKNAVLADDLKQDITDVFNQYQGNKINPARNMTGDLETDLYNLVDSARGEVIQPTFSIKGNQLINDQDFVLNKLGKDDLSAQRFKNALEEGKLSQGKDGAQVYIYPQKEYTNMDLYLTPDSKGGMAIKPDGDIVSVFSHIDNPKGTGGNIIEAAKSVGGKKLDAFDTFLPDFYNKRGFKTYSRDKWNNAYMPSDWDKKHFKQYNNGEPDINYMALDELTVSPLDLQKMKEQIGKMTIWSDEAARNYKNPILEQIYGKYENRLSDLSPELKAANEAYANLRGFQQNEGLKRILRAGDNIDTASTALKNYNNTITKGNTNRNVTDLEKVLVDNGYDPFLNTIDDINATQDLQNMLPTGINVLGVNNLMKGLTGLGLRGQRALNRSGLGAIYEQLGKQYPSKFIPLLYGIND